MIINTDLHLNIEMTITFQLDKDIILYAFDRIITCCGEKKYLFAVQCVWWLASIIGLQQGFVIHIDNLHLQATIGNHNIREILSTPWDIAGTMENSDIPWADRILEYAENYQQKSEQAQKDYVSDLLRRTRQGQANP